MFWKNTYKILLNFYSARPDGTVGNPQDFPKLVSRNRIEASIAKSLASLTEVSTRNFLARKYPCSSQ